MFKLVYKLPNESYALCVLGAVIDKNIGAAAFTIAGSVIPLNTYIDYEIADGVYTTGFSPAFRDILIP